MYKNNLDLSSEDYLSDSSASIHLFGDECDPHFKNCKVAGGKGNCSCYATAVDVTTATEVGLSAVDRKISRSDST